MKTNTTVKAQLQELLNTAHEEVVATRAAYHYAISDTTWENYKEASSLLAQIVELCEANGIEVK